MQSSDATAYRWVRTVKEPLTHCVFDRKSSGGETSRTFGEALRIFDNGWRNIWDRQLPVWGDLRACVTSTLGPRKPRQDWDPLTGWDFHVANVSMSNSAGGIDG
jgi:hypothetical protein